MEARPLNLNLRFLFPALIGAGLAAGSRFAGLLASHDRSWFAFIKNGDWNAQPAVQAALGAMLACGAAWLAMNVHSARRRLMLVFLALMQVFTLSVVLALYGVAFSPFDAAVGIITAWLIAEAMRGTRSGRELSQIRGLLGGRGSSRLATSIQARGGLREFLNVAREVSVLSACLVNAEDFFDIPTAAGNGPLAQSIERIERLVLEQGGFLVQKDAQSILAVLGLGGDENHARSAWSLALELPAAITPKRIEGVAAAMPVPDWRFALDSGEVLPVLITENFVRRLSLAGACINNAPKLVLENLRFGSRTCLSSAFYDAAGPRIEVRPLDLIALPGERHRQEIYELLGATGALDEHRLAARDAFWKGVVLFREGRFPEALVMFDSAKPADAEDPPLSYYLAQTLHRAARNAPRPATVSAGASA